MHVSYRITAFVASGPQIWVNFARLVLYNALQLISPPSTIGCLTGFGAHPNVTLTQSVAHSKSTLQCSKNMLACLFYTMVQNVLNFPISKSITAHSLSMNRASLSHTVAVALLMVLSGCALDARYPQALDPNLPAPAAASEIDHRLILIGDAGAVKHGDPVMSRLTRVASELDSEDVTIVFLGDNIYDYGLPPPDHEGYELARTRLEIQIDAALASGATTVFIPGNHEDDSGGRKAVRRQAQYISTHSNGRSTLIPGGSCPGPIVQDQGKHLRLIYTDSQWLLKQKPPHPCAGDDPNAGIDTSKDFYQALAEAIATAGDRFVVLAAHHPLTTHGPHGGFIAWQQHLFPLWSIDALNGTAWPYLVPVPVLPTVLYALPRSQGLYTNQDLNSTKYRALREDLEGVLKLHSSVPMMIASGHEHSIQILTLPDTPNVLQVVSGSGSIDEHTPVGKGENTLMATPNAGFVVLDVLDSARDQESGRALIAVIEVDESDPVDQQNSSTVHSKHSFRMWVPKREIATSFKEALINP